MKKIPRFKLETVIWEITLKCNLNCIHCGSKAKDIRKNELNTEEALNFCKDLAKLKVEKVCLMGGEPFLREDWYLIAETLENDGIGWSIVSNGQVIEDNIHLLKKLNPFTVGISVDGAKSQTHDYLRGKEGTFSNAIKSIKLLKKNNIPVSIITSVNKLNLKELKSISKLIAGQYLAWQIQDCVPIGRFPRNLLLSKREYYAVALFIVSTLNNFKKFKLYISGAHDFGYFSKYLPNVQIAQWKGCQAGISVIGVQSNGNIKGCLSLPDELIEGNILEESIIKIWNDKEKFLLNRNNNSHQFDDKSICSKCFKFKDCKGGCQGFSHALTGKFYSHPYCLLNYELKYFKDRPLFGNILTKNIFSKIQNEYLKYKFFISQNIRS